MIEQEKLPVLSEDAVYSVIATHPESISRENIASYFGLKSKEIEPLDAHLQTLVRSGKVSRAKDSVSRYVATEPMSDLVVARIGAKPAKGRATLKIENIGNNFPFPVTISEKQIHNHRLKEGERIVVVLERYKGVELRAKFLSRLDRERKATIVGKFNKKAAEGLSPKGNGERIFKPLDKRVRAVFHAVGNIPPQIDTRMPHYGLITSSFNPFKPQVVIGEQKWDPVTGSRIYDVIGSNHGLSHRHEKPATQEAKKSVRRMNIMLRKRKHLYDMRDLSQSPVRIVDPIGARDHDDGIMVQRIPGGFYTLAVIADVPRYVQSEGAVDLAARARGFTHYFPDETFHMLPPILATHACSLLGGKLRPVVFVEQMRDVDGSVYDTQIGLGYINSQQQMTYAQFQHFLIEGSSESHAYRDLQSAIDVKRYHDEIQMDSTSTDYRYSDAQLIVQALMVDANKALAEFLEQSDIPFYRRAHAGHVNPIAYHEIAEEFRAMGYDIPQQVEKLNPAYLNGLIGQAAARGEKDKISTMIRLRLLEPAHYTLRSLGHWGVSAEAYGHFTSPIRRYGDIDNLRAIHTALGDLKHGLTQSDEDRMEKTAAHLNNLQVINRAVQHEAQKYYAVMDLHRLENHSVVAHLIGVRPGGIEIFLPGCGLRKVIAADALPSGWRMTENGRGITDSEVAVLQGARIRVKITDVQPHKAQWDIAKLEPLRGHSTPVKALKRQGVAAPATPAIQLA